MLVRLRKARDTDDSGFTLIELLVVIIIIGILAAIAIPVFLNQRKKGVDASQKSDLRTVANNMETFFTDSQTYPSTAPANVAGTQSVLVGTTSVPLSPGNVITVNYNTNNDAYCVMSTNTKGSHSWVYVSSQGGLQASTVLVCPTGVF